MPPRATLRAPQVASQGLRRGVVTRKFQIKLEQNWNTDRLSRPPRPTKKPRLSGASSYSGGGIRTRDLRVMRSKDGGQVGSNSAFQSGFGSPEVPPVSLILDRELDR